MTLELLVLPGDDIGPEITTATLKVLDAAQKKFDLDFTRQTREMGLATLKTQGTSMPDDVLEEARRVDGVILAPVSTYDYPPVEQGGINPSATIRVALDLYANIRPARTYANLPAVSKKMDLVVVRENTEGFYADRNMDAGIGEFMPTPDVALAVRKITRTGSERIARAAFDLARRRRKRVTVVHKANVLRMSDGFFLKCVKHVAEDYPDIALDESLIDAMTARLVRDASAYDVIVTTNMFGDILSDETAELGGGLGLAGALNAGEAHGVAQATHGSAPDISGQDKANPTALILSTAMLLDWLGARHGKTPFIDAARAIESAIGQTLSDPASRTADLGGSKGTQAFGDAVVANL